MPRRFRIRLRSLACLPYPAVTIPRSSISRVSGLVLGLALCAALVSCGGDGANGSPTGPPGSGAVTVLVVFTPVGGTYSATINNQTFTAAGGFSSALQPGTHEINGSFRAGGFGVGFGSIGGGGAESGSLRSLAGPSPQANACNVLYGGTGSTQQNFRVQFRVTANAGSACQGGSF